MVGSLALFWFSCKGYGSRLLYIFGIPSKARLETVIKNREWIWLGARSDDLVSFTYSS
jgi:hypothetical protein